MTTPLTDEEEAAIDKTIHGQAPDGSYYDIEKADRRKRFHDIFCALITGPLADPSAKIVIDQLLEATSDLLAAEDAALKELEK